MKTAFPFHSRRWMCIWKSQNRGRKEGMKKNIFLFAAALLMVSSNAVSAEEERKSPWETSAELGYVNTSGNTNTETLIFKFDTAYEIEKWKHQAHFEALNTKADDASTPEKDKVTTADKMLVTAQSDFKFTPRDYFYGLLSYEDDKFSGFEYQAKLSLGYGRKVLVLEKHKLDIEIGPGYRNFKVDNASSSEDEYLARLAAKYKWLISDYSEFKQDLVADFGEDQTEWKSITALKSNINKTLAMKLSYTVKYLDVVPAGNDNYDRETAVTLVYTF
jgi:putative salt-induced outer membrane protein